MPARQNSQPLKIISETVFFTTNVATTFPKITVILPTILCVLFTVNSDALSLFLNIYTLTRNPRINCMRTKQLRMIDIIN